MNKKIFALLVVIMVLSTVAIPALAERHNPPKWGRIDGEWCYTPDFDLLNPVLFYESYDPEPTGQITDYGAPGKNFIQVQYTGDWTGTFTGNSVEFGLAIMHEFEPMVFLDAVTFDSVDVYGLSGGLSMDTFGNRPAVGADWKGTWIITGGTDELENLRGYGTFWGPGWLGNPEECGLIYYSVDKLYGVDFK